MTKVIAGGCEVRSERVDALLPDDAAFAAEYARLPAWRRGRCDAFRFLADKRRSVAAWVLLRNILAEACLTPGELVRLAAEPKGLLRDRAFCAMWVRKESYVKACGSGLSTDLKSFSVLPGEEPLGAEFEDFDFGDGHLGCVCRLSDD